MFSSIKRLLLGNLRKQLTVGIVLVVTTMMFLFVWDMTRRQQTVEMDQHSEQVSALASSAATSAAVWVFSRDFSGLQEIILGIARYPGVRHAIVLDLKGQVLAHNDPTKIGLYLTDLPQKPGAPVLQRTASSIEVISPVVLTDRQIGWVRIGLDPAHFNADLDKLWQSGLMYALIGAALSVLLASLTGRYLTRRLDTIQQVASAVQAGASELRVVLPGDDEAAQLARQFNGMMDSLVQREETVKKSEERFRSLTEMSSDFYWETDAQHRLTQRTESQRETRESVFREASSIGKRRWEVSYLSPDESSWQKHRAMLDAHLPFRNFEILRLRSNDAEHWISVSGDPVFSSSGEFMGYRGVGADITERKKTEEVQRFLAKTSSGPADEPFFEALARFLAQSLGMFYVCIDQLEGDGLNAQTLAIWCDGHFEDNVTYALKDTPCGDVVGNQVCCFPASVCQLFPRDQVLQELCAESYIGVTLWSHTGKPIGLIAVIGRTPLENHSLAQTVLKLVAARAAGELERLHAEQTLHESEERWKFAIEGAGDGLWDWNIQTGEAFYSPRYKQMFGFTDADIGTTSDEWSKRVHPEDAPGVFATIQPYLDGKPGAASVEFRMLCKDGCWKWTLGRGMVVNRDVDGKPLRMIGTNADISERKQAEEKIQTLAFSDPLTGLPNRRLLMDRLEQAQAAASRHGHQNALMFIDLDDFKTINDTLGHDRGDVLLKQIAQRLTACVREGDTVARLGGDEFVVLLQELSSATEQAAAQAHVVGTKILSALLEPYELEGHRPYCTASIGVTLFAGRQREDLEEPIKRAELAMYKAKSAARNTLRFFEPDMRTAVATRAAMEADLREAVAKGQFMLHYQGQGTGEDQLIGVEALVRWQHPLRGLVSPAEFIPIAEASGLILPIGRWVLKTACQQLAMWASRPDRADLTVAVNVSARQFRQSDFVQDVLSILQATGANAQRLKLELTESMLVENVEDVITKMNALKAVGVGFSLDDFGTGYSSLNYLKRLPLDQLKIDQSFIREILTDPDDAAIAKTVIALADSLGLSVIAEGVETGAQREFLATLGCNNYQGYLFSKPLPIQEFEAFARRA